MQRRYNFLASVVVLGLTLLMACVDAQARIAFSSERDGNWEIYVMDDDGGNQQRLTNNPSDDRGPSWSPDGKHIAFSSDRDSLRNDLRGTSEIYVMDNDGENQQRLTENPNNDESPSWSPDGKRIAFSSDREGRFNYEIYVMDADGGIYRDSLTMRMVMMTGIPHGLLTVNALPSVQVGRGTLETSLESLMKST